jgi:hypothetical protein
LVRLADELDEDFRRADPKLAERLGIVADSQFFWEFCQRVLSVRPDQKKLEIYIGIKFEHSDAGRVIQLGGTPRLFLSAFAEKLAKINHERIIACCFLPETLRYRQIVVSVRPLKENDKWAKPRAFVFSDATISSEFVMAFPELRVAPINDRMRIILNQIRDRYLDSAIKELRCLEEILPDLPTEAGLRTLWDSACVWSLRASSADPGSETRKLSIHHGLEYLSRWYKYGHSSAWAELGMTAENAVYMIAKDDDLKFLYSSQRSAIRKVLGEDQRFLAYDAGGCVPVGTLIDAPGGAIPVEN